MKLYLAVEIAFIGRATAQTFDPLLSIIASVFESSSSASAELTSSGSAPGFTSSVSASTTQLSGTRSTTLGTVSTTITSATSFTSLIISDSPSNTLGPVTSSTNVLSLTVASTATPSLPRAASASGGTSSDRVAVIALGTILGALVFGLAILAFYLFKRRKLRRANQDRSTERPNESTRPSRTVQQRSASWLGSLRRTRPPGQDATTPRQQYAAAATTQPLMSEGSPIYGLSSPGQIQPAPLFAGTPRGQPKDQPSIRHVQTPNDLETGVNGQPSTTAATATSPPATGVYPTSVRQDGHHERNASDHDVGNPYVDPNPKTPELLQGRRESSTQTAEIIQDKTPQQQYAPLTSHPVPRSGQGGSSSMLGVTADNDDRQTERSSSIPRAGFANAIAGLGIDPDDPSNGDTPAQSTVAEPSRSIPDDSNNNQPVPNPAKEQVDRTSQMPTAVERDQLKPLVPHLSIPKTLMPGRQRSKKTRFSIAGNEEVSPTSESWLDTDDGERGHFRRPSTVSPISPDRNERRAVSENFAHRQLSKRGITVGGTGNPISAPAALSSRTLQSKLSQSSKLGRNVMIPGVHHVQQEGEQQQQQVPKPQRASAPAENIRRKPVPLDLATLIRKPLPPHPVPTSKFNQSARSIAKPPAARTAPQDPTSKHENIDNVSRRTEGDQVFQARHHNVPAAFAGMDQKLSEIHNQQTKPKLVVSTSTDDSRNLRPVSEVLDNNGIIASYMQPASRESSQNTTNPRLLHPPQHMGHAGLSRRDTVQFFEDPGNKEYAQVYGSYYAQQSPVQFSSPTSPHPENYTYLPVQHHEQQYQQQHQYQYQPQTQQNQYYQPQGQYQERSRYIPQPPQPQLQPQSQLQAQPRNYPGYVKPVYQHVPPPLASASHQGDPGTLAATTATTSPYPWRDSQQDAWRDSLSRSGSDLASASGTGNGAASGTGKATSNASSGGGGGPGLWGSPGFFGAER